jgi:hypothetical protein
MIAPSNDKAAWRSLYGIPAADAMGGTAAFAAIGLHHRHFSQ